MANKLKMDTKQAITSLVNQGWSQRRIAKGLGVHRRTVTRLLKSIDDSKGAISMTGNGPGRTSKCEPYRACPKGRLHPRSQCAQCDNMSISRREQPDLGKRGEAQR